MNYMTEVAKMLGVELNEYFTCKESPCVYCITKHDCLCNGVRAAESLMMLLDGTLTVDRKYWKPHHGDTYYCVSSNGYVLEEKWYGDVIDRLYYKLGNCYNDASKAETNRDKWISFYASDEVLEV